MKRPRSFRLEDEAFLLLKKLTDRENSHRKKQAESNGEIFKKISQADFLEFLLRKEKM